MKREDLQSYLPLVAGLLLAVYGSAGVLGYGLHSIWGCDHCHHVAGLDFSPRAVAYGCDLLLEAPVEANSGKLVPAQEDCPICAFLVQSQSEFVVQSASECVDLIPTIPPAIVSSYVSPLLGTHPGRGPPAC